MRQPEQFGSFLWRGSKPETEADYRLLRQIGIRTILDLQADWDNQGLEFALEFGMTRLQLALCPVFPPSSEEDYQIASRVIGWADKSNPVFVHCKKGCDRTGFIVAKYRMRVLGWTREHAIDEMVAMGNSWWLRWWTWFL